MLAEFSQKRESMDPSKFLERTIDLNSKMDPLYPSRYPHVGRL